MADWPRCQLARWQVRPLLCVSLDINEIVSEANNPCKWESTQQRYLLLKSSNTYHEQIWNSFFAEHPFQSLDCLSFSGLEGPTPGAKSELSFARGLVFFHYSRTGLVSGSLFCKLQSNRAWTLLISDGAEPGPYFIGRFGPVLAWASLFPAGVGLRIFS